MFGFLKRRRQRKLRQVIRDLQCINKELHALGHSDSFDASNIHSTWPISLYNERIPIPYTSEERAHQNKIDVALARRDHQQRIQCKLRRSLTKRDRTIPYTEEQIQIFKKAEEMALKRIYDSWNPKEGSLLDHANDRGHYG